MDNRFIAPLLHALGIDQALGYVLSMMIIAIGLLFSLVGSLRRSMAAVKMRQDMQSDHFDVVERDINRALNRADEAVSLHIKTLPSAQSRAVKTESCD